MQPSLKDWSVQADRGRVAIEIHTLRIKAGLTQAELAERVGTTTSVISRLENLAYCGHSLPMLWRIALALGYEVVVRFTKKRTRPTF